MDPRPETASIVIGSRFRGPAGSGNGGYTAGRLAALLPSDPETGVRITLRQPPPLDIELTAQPVTDPAAGPVTGARLMLGDTLVAEGQSVRSDIAPIEAVSLAEASEAETEYAGFRAHPFPGCFTCGTERQPGDGLRLAPGRVSDGRTACTWTPDASLAHPGGWAATEFTWAALDCPGGWTVDLEGRPMVLGQITAQVDAEAMVGERHVVVGKLLGEDGRKTFTATTLYDSDGRVVARAGQVWISVDPSVFGG